MVLAYERPRRAGDGAQPLVLLHGLGSSRSVWNPVLPALAERFDVIAVDLPGHGESPPFAPGADATPAGIAASVASLLDALSLPRVHVAGNSLGGWIALELAAAGRAHSVTALAPAGLWDTTVVPVIAHVNRWAARAAAPLAPTLLQSRALRALGFWSASANGGQLDPHTAIDAVRAHASARGWAAALAGTHRRHLDPDAVPVDVPVTVVWGDQDRILPDPDCQKQSMAPRHARWVRLSDCGHVPMWDQPQQTVRLIEQTADAAQPRTARSTSPTAAGRG